MLFGKLLTNGKKFGASIGHDVKKFGRNMSSTATKVSTGIERAQHKLSGIEKKMGGAPIIGTGLKTIGSIMEGAKDIAKATASGGQALTNVARGDFSGAKGDFNSIKSSLSGAMGAGRSALMSGGETVAGAATLL